MTWSLEPASSLNQLSDVWQELNGRAADSALLHPDFVLPLLGSFASGDERLAICRDAHSSIAAMMLLQRTKRGTWQTFQPSQAPLALLVSNPDMTPSTLLPGLLRALPGFPLIMAITRLDPGLHARPASTSTQRSVDYIRTARIRINGDFESYWSQRGKNLRHNIKRQRNRLAKDGIETKLVVLTHPDDMAAGVAAYGELESRGWKGDESSAVHRDNAQGRYYTEMLQRFAARAESRIYQYWYGGDLVATDLCVQRNGVLVILKTTYDERQKVTSPAMLMRHEAFTHIFLGGEVHTIEFYGQVMDWHTKWSDDIRTMYHLNQYRWPLLAALHGRRRPSNNNDSVTQTTTDTD